MPNDFTRALVALMILVTATSSVVAADFFVATTGDDGNVGTQALPFATVQRGIDEANAGDTVHIRGGVYNEIVSAVRSGSSGAGYIIIQSFSGETAILDATGISVPSNSSAAIFRIDGFSFLRIDGLELRNFTTSQSGRVPMGIHLTGAATNVEILNCEIHHIETNFTGLNNGDAHGIGVFGDTNIDMHDILIDGNTIRDCRLGSSEALVVNGNVRDFIISNNTVHDCNNIGIDAIGFEGVAPSVAKDQARDGVIRDNHVFNIDARFNPAYGGNFNSGGGDPSAGGIYVDGGTRILIERNVVHDCNIGVELASENAGRATSFITLRDNLIHENHIGGLFLGGFDTQRGATEDVLVTNNTFFQNDTFGDFNGEVLLQFDTKRITVKNNLFAAGSQGVFVNNPFTENVDNLFDFNQYSRVGNIAPEWFWKNVFYGSLTDWQNGTGNDLNSQFVADPLLEAPGSGNFRQTSSSPGLDFGDPSFVPGVGETDLDGLARVANGRVDLGAYEFQDGPPVILTQPEGQTLLGVQPVMLAVEASGAASLDYAWFEGVSGDDSSPVGTNAATLTVTPAVSSDYWVRITSVVGSIDSETATITVVSVDPIRAETLASPTSAPSTTPVTAFLESHAGLYNGLLWNSSVSDDLLGDASKIKVKSSGGFSGRVSWERRSIRFKGEFDGSGAASVAARRKKGETDLVFSLQLAETGSDALRLVGTVTDGTTTADFTAARSPWNKKTLPATTAAGSYTILIPMDPNAAATRPSGDGYGTVAINAAGRVKVKAVLGDATRFSVNAYLSGDEDIALYRALYRGKTGHLGGTVTLRETVEVSDLDGALSWEKVADAKSKLYSAGFAIPAVWAIGSRYEPPAKGEFVLDTLVEGENNSVVYFEGGNFSVSPFNASFVTWDTKNKLTYSVGDERIPMKVNARTGLFSGKYTDKAVGLKFKFGGVAFQKQPFVSGTLVGDGETGVVAVRPTDP